MRTVCLELLASKRDGQMGCEMRDETKMKQAELLHLQVICDCQNVDLVYIHTPHSAKCNHRILSCSQHIFNLPDTCRKVTIILFELALSLGL